MTSHKNILKNVSNFHFPDRLKNPPKKFLNDFSPVSFIPVTSAMRLPFAVSMERTTFFSLECVVSLLIELCWGVRVSLAELRFFTDCAAWADSSVGLARAA